MAKSKPSGTIPGLDTIVDADAHIVEKPGDYVPYIDDDHAAAKRILESSGSISSQVFSASYMSPPENEHYETVEGQYRSGESDKPAHDPESKLREMDDFGIERSIIGPTYTNGLPAVNNPQLAVALANGYNAWVVDQYGDWDPDRFKLLLSIAPQEPEAAVAEIERWADEDCIVGVGMSPAGLLPPHGHRKYDPIYEAAEANGLPMVLHGLISALPSHFHDQYVWGQSNAEAIMFGHPFQNMWNLVTLMFRGVPERYPDLEFVIQECGIAWVPYWTWRMDDIYLEHPNQIASLRRPPSEYIEENFYFTTQPLGNTRGKPGHLAKAIELAGTGSVMYSADLPHPTFDPPEELYDRIKPHLDDGAVEDIMYANAADVFGL